MTLALLHKCALVTGSTSGIGLAVARSLASQGANIMLNGFGDEAEITSLQQKIAEEYGVKVGYHAANLQYPEEISALINTTISEMGALDILVNNAGIQHVDPIEDFPPERWEAVININLNAVYHTIHHALPSMKNNGWGRIINIASAHGLVASKGKSAYVAAKHAVLGLTKTVGLETAKEPITCNAICPGWVLTPLVQKQIDAISAEQNISNNEAKHQLLSEKQPSCEFVTPEAIGEAVLYLCSHAASNMKGASLVIDGGWTAQ